MRKIESVCVFAGSSPGARPEFALAARSLGHCIARHGLTVVFIYLAVVYSAAALVP